ncbi:MAG: TAXI family TRAP transporter solute-binding subunit [Hyphomicrobiaceae bacterium]
MQGKAIAAPKRAQPVPPKPVSEEEALRAARINNWTVGLAGGLLEGTFVRYAADLGKALDDGDNLRVLPIVSYGAVGNVSDLIYLKGVDFSITYSDVLDHFKNIEKVPGIERRINYVMPMFQGELHIYARPEIKSIRDLEGKKVNFNTVGSAANYTGGIVFDRLGIKAQRIFENNSIALEAMRRGEIAAIVHVVGKPNDLFSKIKPEPGYRFLPVEFSEKFEDYYVPAELTNADYPNLIAQGETVQTISVTALLAVYNWNKDTDRYRRCVRFIEYLFDRFDKLRQPPYQPKWKEMNIAGTIPGWQRFPPAQELIDKMAASTGSVNTSLARAQAAKAAPLDPAEQERLFRQFLEWSKQKR